MKTTFTHNWLCLAGLGLGLSLSSGARAQTPAAGTLDASFGTGGKVFLNFTAPVTTPDEGRAVVVQPDGKLVVAGQENGGAEVARFNANGTLDTSFGTNGRVVYYFGTVPYGGISSPLPSRVRDLQLLPNGQLLVIGRTGAAGYMARLQPNGALDPTWGTNGVVRVQPGSRGATLYDAARQADGRAVAFSTVYQLTRTAAAVFRYQSTGTSDPSFGIPGIGIYLLFPPNQTNSFCTSGVVSPDDKVLAGGYTAGASSSASGIYGSRAGVAQLLANGTLDTSFGTNGYAMLPFGGVSPGSFFNTTCQDVALQADGKILLVGAIERPTQPGVIFVTPQGLVARFNANGTLDPSFGAGTGYVAIAFAGSSKQCLTRVLVQPDGKILASGHSSPAGGATADFALVRLNPDGTPDAAFGTSGQVVINQGNQDLVRGIALQADGKIVGVGSTAASGGTVTEWDADERDENYNGNPQNGQLALFRLLGSGPLSAAAPAVAAQVALYPNPAATALTITLPTGLTHQPVEAEVFNLLGQRVHTQTLPAGPARHVVALPRQAPGMRVLLLHTAAGTISKRFAVE